MGADVDAISHTLRPCAAQRPATYAWLLTIGLMLSWESISASASSASSSPTRVRYANHVSV